MKHLMLVLAAMLMPVMLFGQQKLIENAMKNRQNGHFKGQFYGVRNTSEILLYKELQSYCEQNGLYHRGAEWKKVMDLNTITYFEILPMDEVDEFIYTDKCEFTSKPSFDALFATGKGWFFTDDISVQLDNIKWSGTVRNGLINGYGTGYCKNLKDQIYYFISGEFEDGFPKGEVVFAVYEYKYEKSILKGVFLPTRITFGEMSDGMAWVKRALDKKYGFVSADGRYVATDKYVRVIQPFRNGRAEVVQIDGKEIIINKNCNFVGYTELQQGKDAEQHRLEEEKRLAEQRRIQDSLDRIERARVEEERRRAEHERKIIVNCNYKLWSKGDHICYVFPNGSYKDKIACGTLEEWNENRTKAHIKIVTSPSNSLTYDGELLEKNNTFWISTQGTKWHLAIEGEFEKSLEYDNSKKSPDVIYVNNQSSSDVRRYNDCSYCHGSGRLKCLSCHGSGWDSWDDKTCTSCRGQGTEQCYHCGGTGKE